MIKVTDNIDRSTGAAAERHSASKGRASSVLARRLHAVRDAGESQIGAAVSDSTTRGPANAGATLPTEPTVARKRLSWAGGRRFRAPFSHREYRVLIAALALSITAGGMWTVVMPMQVVALRNDPVALSLVATCFGGAAAASVLLGGVAADRFSQRRIIVAVQSLNWVVVAALAMLAVAGGLQLWHMAVGSALLGLCTGVLFPALNAYMVRILPEEQLAAANGVDGVMRPALQSALGPTLAGVILGATFPTVGLVVIAVLSGIGVIMLVALRPATSTRPMPERQRAHALADLRDGLMFVVRTRWLLWTMLHTAVITLVATGPLEVLLPFITQKSGHGALALGMVVSLLGTGAAIGSIAAAAGGLPRRYLTVMMASLGLGMMPFLFLANTSTFPVMVAAALTLGCAQGLGTVIRTTVIQRKVSKETIGRVASVDMFISLALLPVSTALAGPLAEAVGVDTLFAVAAFAPPVAAVVAFYAGRMGQEERSHPLS